MFDQPILWIIPIPPSIDGTGCKLRQVEKDDQCSIRSRGNGLATAVDCLCRALVSRISSILGPWVFKQAHPLMDQSIIRSEMIRQIIPHRFVSQFLLSEVVKHIEHRADEWYPADYPRFLPQWNEVHALYDGSERLGRRSLRSALE